MILNNLFKSLLVGAVFLGSTCTANSQMIVAHRGASFDAPENTIAAFKLAWEQGADAIEGDFHLTSDNQIVCIHDKTTLRTSPNVPELVVAETKLSGLQKLDSGSWKDKRFANERMPTLEQVLATVPAGKKIFVEVKCGVEIVPQLKKTLEDSGLADDQIVIICFNKTVIKSVRQQMPQYKANWLTSYKNENEQQEWRPTPKSVLSTLNDTLATGLGTQFNTIVVDKALVNSVHKAGKEFHVWTVDDIDELKTAINFKVDSITTNRPAIVHRLLAPAPADVSSPGR